MSNPCDVLARAAYLALLGALAFGGGSTSLTAQEVTLDQCLELALARNPAIAVQAGRALEAEADHAAAHAPLRPTASASAYANQLNGDRMSPGGASLPPETSLFTREGFAGLTARQLIYDGRRSSSARDAAASGVAEQRNGLTAVRDETVMRVTQTFYRALAAAELVGVARQAADRAGAFEVMAEELFRTGRVTRLDALKAASARVEAERELAAAREAHAILVVQLAQVIGLDGGISLVPFGTLPDELREPPLPDDAVAAALERNPDLRGTTYQIERSRANLQVARGAHRPTIAAQGAYGYRDRNMGSGRPEWLVGLAVNWAFLDGGAVSAQVSLAEARLAQAEDGRRALELDIGEQVRSVLSGWRLSLSDARAAALLVETGREELAAAEALYAAGKAIALEVLTAGADLARAEGARVTAAADYAVARARLERLTGSLPGGAVR
ncbi:MAG: TolC family protein [Longimicrobiales bacterium]